MNKTALVTGASGGLGLEFSKILAQNGYDLVLVARSADKLQGLAQTLSAQHGVQALALPKDLSRPEAPLEIRDELAARKLRVDVLVNDAGFGNFGEYAGTDWSRESAMIQVNITALAHLTKLFLPGMLSRRDGKILNVASTAAFEPGPLMAMYYATKAFVLSFSEALARETAGTGVTVTALCPGPTKTGFEQTAALKKSKLFRSLRPADAHAVAQFGYDAMRRGRAVAIPGAANKLLIFGVRLLPRRAVRGAIYRLQGKVR